MTMQSDNVLVQTPRCRMCGQSSFVAVRACDLERYNAGALVQEAFPEMPAEKRELLISGVHAECWEQMWSEN